MRQAESVFIDTSYVLALVNEDASYHAKAQQLSPLLVVPRKIYITEAVILEIGNALSTRKRDEAASFVRQCYDEDNIEVSNVTTDLVMKALDLFEKRPDKLWGLVDCVSFVVMKQNRIKQALTSDKHFVQAGFQALLLN
jgi:uncharacterized protein